LRVGFLAAGLWLALCNCEAVLAQTAGNPAFEVASVKLNKSTTQEWSRFPLGPGDAYVPGDLFLGVNQPLIAYLRFAFKRSQSELLDVPAWVYDEHFDIAARAAGTPTKDQMRLMIRSLLEDRFQLKIHTVRRRKPAFNLVVALPGRIGPQLGLNTSDSACSGRLTGQSASQKPTSKLTKPSAKSGLQLPPIPCGYIGAIPASAPDKTRFGGRRVTSERIAEFFTVAGVVDRQVLDQTGLTGTFNFSLEWSPDHGPIGPNEPAAPAPGFLRALRNQLGLKLVATTAPLDVLIIDSIQRPDEN
jgi:uncharacterized protein (TIGR03435 family)